MVCWKVSNIACIIEVFILLLWLAFIIDVSVAIEHAIGLVVTIRVHFFTILSLWLHLPAQEIWVNLLIWINTILLIFIWLLHLLLHLVHLLLFHLRILVIHLVWLLIRLVLIVICVWVHVVSYLKNYIS